MSFEPDLTEQQATHAVTDPVATTSPTATTDEDETHSIVSMF